MFWEKVASEEADRDVGDRKNFIPAYAQPLMGMLTSVMVSPHANVEDDDDGEFGPYNAAQNAFLEVARAVGGDAMTAAIMPWVTQCSGSAEWQQREAAAMVLGMLQEFTSSEKMLPVNQGALGALWARLLNPAGSREEHPKVREAIAFFVAKTYYHHGPGLFPASPAGVADLKEAARKLCTLLATEAAPPAKALAATAINYLFSKFNEDRDNGVEGGALFQKLTVPAAAPGVASVTHQTTVFSGRNGLYDIFQLLVQKGVEAIGRGSEEAVAVECFGAVNSLLMCAGVEDVDTVTALLRDVGMAKITESVQKCMPAADRPPLTVVARQKEAMLQERYVGLVHSILTLEQELTKGDPPVDTLTRAIAPLAQPLCSLLLGAVDCGLVNSDAWYALGLLIDSAVFAAAEDPPGRPGLSFWCRAEVLGAVHLRIMKGLAAADDIDNFYPSLIAAGDVMRKLGASAPAELVQAYLERAVFALESPEVESKVKPAAIELFQDFAPCMSVAKHLLPGVLLKIRTAAAVPDGVRGAFLPAPSPLPPPRRNLNC